jgi:thiol-disulfide isomerase/thioredoxin
MNNLNFLPLLIKTGLLITSITISTTNVSAKEEIAIQPFIKGSFEQIQQKHKGTPYIVSFWSETCGYCMQELSLLGKLVRTFSNVKVITDSTDPFLAKETVNRILSTKNLQHMPTWVFADHYAGRLYPDVDLTWRGELPLTYFFDRDNNKVKHMGTINKQELTNWFAEQNKVAKK